ncbi:DUF1015 domain-containing protein [Candidatus Omnitrophota bacterium]
MADIIPFKGVLYNPEKIKDLSKVVAPPYDVISKEEQKELYDSDPHNIIRILLGECFPDDNEKENRYVRAERFLKDWKGKDLLKRDDRDSIYVYSQEFTIDEKVISRLGFIALLKLEEFNVGTSSVYPHEDTFQAPKEDRSRLIESIEANLGPIFALFKDEEKHIDAILVEATRKSQPIIDIVDHHGARNRLWRISEKETMATIVRLIKPKLLFIADGHHRYEVGLEFSKLKSDHKYGRILTYFTDLYADGIIILPVHRLIAGVNNDTLSYLKGNLRKDFLVKELASKVEAKTFLSGAHHLEKRFVIYDGRMFTGLSRSEKDSLDVNVLHSLIIGPLEKKATEAGEKISIDFTKDLGYAIDEVDKGRRSLSILLNPTKIDQVCSMAFSGKRMPQKSTYFYPKVLTGLVINVF